MLLPPRSPSVFPPGWTRAKHFSGGNAQEGYRADVLDLQAWWCYWKLSEGFCLWRDVSNSFVKYWVLAPYLQLCEGYSVGLYSQFHLGNEVVWSVEPVLTLAYGHDLWVMTGRRRSWLQTAEIFLHRVVGHSLRDRLRRCITREELGVGSLLLHIERSQLRSLGHLHQMLPGHLPQEPSWAQKMLWHPPGRAGGSVRGEGRLAIPAEAAVPMTWSWISRGNWINGNSVIYPPPIHGISRCYVYQ